MFDDIAGDPPVAADFGLDLGDLQIRALPLDEGGGDLLGFLAGCAQLGLCHRYTQTFSPRTNGKAERFTQAALREWAVVHVYDTFAQRAENKPRWLPLLQLAPATRRSQGQNAHQPNRPDRRQSVEIPQSEASRNRSLRQQA